MTRLTELYAMRERIDDAIRREEGQMARIAHLRDHVYGLLEQPSERTAAILDLTARLFNIDVSEMVEGSRRPPAVGARQVAAFVLRDEGHSLPQIGRTLQQHHTTVLHSCRKVDSSLVLRAAVERTKAQLAEHDAESAVAS